VESPSDGGGKTGRAGADNGGVIDRAGIDRPDQPDATGQFALGGIAQNLAARTQHDRQMLGLDGEAPQEGLGATVIAGIQRLVRMAIAPQKILQPQHVQRTGRSDQDGTALSLFEQAHAPEDQGAHDALAQRGFLHQHIAQPGPRHQQRLHIGGGDGIHQRGTLGKLGQFAQEISRPMPDDHVAGRYRAAVRYLDLALQDKGQAFGDLARLHDRRAGGIAAQGAETLQTRHLRRLQMQEHLVPAGLEDGFCRCFV
jgi:hypothetical protein